MYLFIFIIKFRITNLIILFQERWRCQSAITSLEIQKPEQSHTFEAEFNVSDNTIAELY